MKETLGGTSGALLLPLLLLLLLLCPLQQQPDCLSSGLQLSGSPPRLRRPQTLDSENSIKEEAAATATAAADKQEDANLQQEQQQEHHDQPQHDEQQQPQQQLQQQQQQPQQQPQKQQLQHPGRKESALSSNDWMAIASAVSSHLHSEEREGCAAPSVIGERS